MKDTDIINALLSSGIPGFNTISDAGVKLPYFVFTVSYPANTAADNMNYCINPRLHIELYTLGKDYESMNKLEGAMQSAGLPWQHDTSFLDGQGAFMEVYDTGSVAGPWQELTPAPDPTPEPEPTPEPDETPEGVEDGTEETN